MWPEVNVQTKQWEGGGMQHDWLCWGRSELMWGCVRAVWLTGCASPACWTLDVASVTVRTPRRSSPPPAFQSIRPPLSKQRGAGESEGTTTPCFFFCDDVMKMWNDSLHLEGLTGPSHCLGAPTPAWWGTTPTGPTTTAPPPTPGSSCWLWCST